MFVLTHHPREPLVLEGTTFTFYLRAGLLDELQVHVAPRLLGGGTRLFDGVGPADLEIVRTVESPAATHIRYRVVR